MAHSRHIRHSAATVTANSVIIGRVAWRNSANKLTNADEKLLLRCRLLGPARRFGAHAGGEGRGISWRPPARLQLVRAVLKNRSTFCLVAEVKGKAARQFRAVFTAYIAFAFVLWVCRFRGVISMAMNKIFNDCKSIEFPQRLV